MSTYHSQRCGLCGQFTPVSDREAMLEADRWEWDEALVDEARVDSHFCVDRDPHGARESARLVAAGLIAPELRWLIEAELERRQASPAPAWTVFAGAAATVLAVSVLALAVTASAAGRRRNGLWTWCDHCGRRKAASRLTWINNGQVTAVNVCRACAPYAHPLGWRPTYRDPI